MDCLRWGLLLWLLHLTRAATSPYQVGVGIADITGPPAEVPFMGYANPEQKGGGLHLRQFARSFIVVEGQRRLVFVSADCGMMGTYLRIEVLKRLRKKFGDEMYTRENVMLSGTHTHSTPGGFLMDILFDLNSWGFVPQTFEAYVSGITRSIIRAHECLKDGWIELGRGDVPDASINRSPTSYLENPPEERARFQYDVDKTFTQLKFYSKSGDPMGVITWFAVHPTSMNNTNQLVSSDNVGLASIMFEKRLNKAQPIGKGPFVAAFASTNLGDVSPNIAGPRCVPSGKPCDLKTSSCADHKDTCIAFGPGRDMFESTYIIASRMADKAWEAWRNSDREVVGPLSVVHQYVDMPSQSVPYIHPNGSLIQVKGCLASMGYSFAAGTTDGHGMFSFKQGTKSTNPLWNAFTYLVAPPTPELIECQAPKPILLATGEMEFPFEWQPRIVSTQLARLGPVVLACVPGEFTTMSGRRMRTTLASQLPGVPPDNVIIAGLCNTYADYIATPEEYQVQRYEGASTIYGPHTLTIYLEQYKKLALHLREGSRPEPGPEPPDNRKNVISLLPPVIFDRAGWDKEFGQVLQQPSPQVSPGQTVSAIFVSGHPRNGLQTEASYLKIERKNEESGDWDLVATDSDWETKMMWRRTSSFTGTSTVEVVWEVPRGTPPGLYKIRHFGHHKCLFEGISPYEGTSNTFSEVKKKEKKPSPKVTVKGAAVGQPERPTAAGDRRASVAMKEVAATIGGKKEARVGGGSRTTGVPVSLKDAISNMKKKNKPSFEELYNQRKGNMGDVEGETGRSGDLMKRIGGIKDDEMRRKLESIMNFEISTSDSEEYTDSDSEQENKAKKDRYKERAKKEFDKIKSSVKSSKAPQINTMEEMQAVDRRAQEWLRKGKETSKKMGPGAAKLKEVCSSSEEEPLPPVAKGRGKKVMESPIVPKVIRPTITRLAAAGGGGGAPVNRRDEMGMGGVGGGRLGPGRKPPGAVPPAGAAAKMAPSAAKPTPALRKSSKKPPPI